MSLLYLFPLSSNYGFPKSRDSINLTLTHTRTHTTRIGLLTNNKPIWIRLCLESITHMEKSPWSPCWKMYNLFHDVGLETGVRELDYRTLYMLDKNRVVDTHLVILYITIPFFLFQWQCLGQLAHISDYSTGYLLPSTRTLLDSTVHKA